MSDHRTKDPSDNTLSPTGAMRQCIGHEYVREPDAPRGYACAHCHCSPPDGWYPETLDE